MTRSGSSRATFASFAPLVLPSNKCPAWLLQRSTWSTLNAWVSTCGTSTW